MILVEVFQVLILLVLIILFFSKGINHKVNLHARDSSILMNENNVDAYVIGKILAYNGLVVIFNGNSHSLVQQAVVLQT